MTLPLDLDAIQTKLDEALIAAEGEKGMEEEEGQEEEGRMKWRGRERSRKAVAYYCRTVH